MAVRGAGLRVIGGTLRGRRLDGPSWEGLRPTSDRLRETLFNVLAPHVRGARVLDGYAGTGAVGIEALSRGATHVTFVESDPRAVRLIESNLDRCGLRGARLQADSRGVRRQPNGSAPYAIIRARFAAAAERLVGREWGVIFLDPPYGAAASHEALAAAAPLAGDRTLVILEHATRDSAPDGLAGLIRTRDLGSGDSALAFYRRGAGRPPPESE